ncbi:energy transducer TonB [Nitrospira defluvii]|nr:energy transducer TonB [Nitrospira defluvii]
MRNKLTNICESNVKDSAPLSSPGDSGKLEGMVTIEFTIQIEGSVSDPIVIVSAPPKIFDLAALRAIRKWKFRPKQVKEKAVVRRAIQNIRFSLKRGKK